MAAYDVDYLKRDRIYVGRGQNKVNRPPRGSSPLSDGVIRQILPEKPIIAVCFLTAQKKKHGARIS